MPFMPTTLDQVKV